MGAWIETEFVYSHVNVQIVAPHVGAWIETSPPPRQNGGIPSHPTWVRGLKRSDFGRPAPSLLSHPTWVRGLKLLSHCKYNINIWSHPTWVRGLKQGCKELYMLIKASHPTWVRGLKLTSIAATPIAPVAPHVGAWIETHRDRDKPNPSCRTPRGCVD